MTVVNFSPERLCEYFFTQRDSAANHNIMLKKLKLLIMLKVFCGFILIFNRINSNV